MVASTLPCYWHYQQDSRNGIEREKKTDNINGLLYNLLCNIHAVIRTIIALEFTVRVPGPSRHLSAQSIFLLLVDICRLDGERRCRESLTK
jgi:hypothetical protein